MVGLCPSLVLPEAFSRRVSATETCSVAAGGQRCRQARSPDVSSKAGRQQRKAVSFREAH